MKLITQLEQFFFFLVLWDGNGVPGKGNERNAKKMGAAVVDIGSRWECRSKGRRFAPVHLLF